MTDRFQIDGHKMHYHPEWVAKWLACQKEWEAAKCVWPLYAEVTTSAACNHRCSFCSVDSIGYPQIMIDRGKLKETLATLAHFKLKSVMFAGTGEPLLHKEINAIVEDSRAEGLDVAFTTNAVLLHKLETIDQCSWVKISMNAGTREDYAAIHKTNPKDWDTIWRTLPRALGRRKSCALGLQCVVLPENVGGLRNLAQMATDVGVDYLVFKPYSQGTFSIVQRSDIDYSAMDKELSAIEEDFPIVVYRRRAMQQESEPHHYEKCLATPMSWIYFMATGDVFSCSAHLLDERFNLGNIYKQHISEIWYGEKRKQNYLMMRDTFDIKACRKNCRMNSVNVFLDQMKHGVPHQSFI